MGAPAFWNLCEATMGQLSGKRAIVTGAASGIGRASVLLFVREGARVLAVDRNEDGVNETAELARQAGGGVVAVGADVADEASVQAYTARAIAELGGLDIVYANAGISAGALPLWEQSAQLWSDTLRVNLLAPFLAIKSCGPHMIEQGHGAIVLTASVAGMRANASSAPYSASKAGVISLVQTAADSLAGTGVRINAVCPGLIETGMTRSTFDRARARGTEDKIGQLNPQRRAGQPEEVAALALFLASDAASYVNGQAIPVDGGLSSTLPFVRVNAPKN
jgi:NAD(P)-dependent dehydrogenase (short-subunit alcohol dehydrogenase family)